MFKHNPISQISRYLLLETYELKEKDQTKSDKSPCNQIWQTFQREYQSCKEGQRVRKVAQNVNRKSRDFTIVFFLTLHLRVRWRKWLNYECCLLGWQGLPEGPPRPRREVGQKPGDRRAEEFPRGGPAPQWTSIQIVGYLQHRTRRCRFKEWTFLHEEAF